MGLNPKAVAKTFLDVFSASIFCWGWVGVSPTSCSKFLADALYASHRCMPILTPVMSL